VHREQDDLGLREARLDLPRRRDAAHVRHADVHEHQVRLQLSHLLQRLVTVGSRADDLDLLFQAEQPDQPVPHQLMVIHYQQSDHLSPFSLIT
jgi:hypothetical protein